MKKMNYEEAMEVVERVQKNTNGTWWQFRTCQAYLGEICNLYDNEGNFEGNYRLFKSYATIVALVDIDNGVVYRLGKWSRTTSKQTSQFCNEYYRNFEQVQF